MSKKERELWQRRLKDRSEQKSHQHGQDDEERITANDEGNSRRLLNEAGNDHELMQNNCKKHLCVRHVRFSLLHRDDSPQLFVVVDKKIVMCNVHGSSLRSSHRLIKRLWCATSIDRRFDRRIVLLQQSLNFSDRSTSLWCLGLIVSPAMTAYKQINQIRLTGVVAGSAHAAKAMIEPIIWFSDYGLLLAAPWFLQAHHQLSMLIAAVSKESIQYRSIEFDPFTGASILLRSILLQPNPQTPLVTKASMVVKYMGYYRISVTFHCRGQQYLKDKELDDPLLMASRRSDNALVT